MEKKKFKIWQIIMLSILIILCIFAINVTRKTIILAQIDQKVTNCENNNNNIYIKTILENTVKIETFIKENVNKTTMERKDSDGNESKIIQIIYPNERKLYTESKEGKVMYTYEEKAPLRGAHIENESSYSTIGNAGYSWSIFNRIFNAMVTRIKTVELDGEKYYEMSSLYNTNFIYSENTKNMITYVNKDTGLNTKRIEKIEENGNIEEKVTTFEYEFNTVTDEDIKEPEASDYKIMEKKVIKNN